MFKIEPKIYDIKDLDYIISLFNDKDFILNNKGILYFNHPVSFDIETSSFYEEDEKRAIMYAFTFNINGYSIIGRSWLDFVTILNKWARHLINNQGEHARVLIYVHNLSYEFQFIRKILKWSSLFFNEERNPLKAVTDNGIFEFRCSLQLSGYKLETLGKNLTKYPVRKLVGNLDYSKLRTPLTSMTSDELAYLKNDGDVVVSYIQEEIENHRNTIYNIELTKTGKVRKHMKKVCLYSNSSSHKKKEITYQYNKYQRIMRNIQIKSELEYSMLKEAFAGGFTHASNFASNRVFNDVASLDETSAYPYQLVSKEYPMSNAEYVEIKSIDELERNNKLYCTLFKVSFKNIKEKLSKCYEHYISLSKCTHIKGQQVDNGRVVKAKELSITITNVDYDIIKEYYEWSSISVGTFIRYKKMLLPTVFVRGVLDLYKMKTELKGIKEKEVIYKESKEKLNSIYGMCVTDICRDEIEYTDFNEYIKESPNVADVLKRYNTNKQRFIAYQWGVWCTAYNRRDLFKAISECKSDYHYSDTDSVKISNYSKHKAFFDKYNDEVRTRLIEVAKYHNLDFSLFEPTTIKGDKKLIGVFDYEETYKSFKTLGAKRYMVSYNDPEIIKAIINGKEVDYSTDFSITVAGVNKNHAIPYITELAKKKKCNVFDLFKMGLEVPKEYTGKMTHTYIDDEIKGKVKDYEGKIYSYDELSCVHLENTSFIMSLNNDYLNYLFGIDERNLK